MEDQTHGSPGILIGIIVPAISSCPVAVDSPSNRPVDLLKGDLFNLPTAFYTTFVPQFCVCIRVFSSLVQNARKRNLTPTNFYVETAIPFRVFAVFCEVLAQKLTLNRLYCVLSWQLTKQNHSLTHSIGNTSLTGLVPTRIFAS